MILNTKLIPQVAMNLVLMKKALMNFLKIRNVLRETSIFACGSKCYHEIVSNAVSVVHLQQKIHLLNFM